MGEYVQNVQNVLGFPQTVDLIAKSEGYPQDILEKAQDILDKGSSVKIWSKRKPAGFGSRRALFIRASVRFNCETAEPLHG